MQRPSRQQTGPPAPTLAVYGGRPEDCAVQTECELRALGAETPSPELRAALTDAAALVVLEPFGFPFDSLREADWEIPVVAALPHDRGAATLLKAVDERLLGRLTFFDRIATDDDALWARLRTRFGWGQCQRIDSSDHAEIIRAVATLNSLDASDRAAERAQLALRESKAVHLSQTRALRPVLRAAHKLITREGRLRMLEVGAGVGERASLVRAKETELVGVDARPACVREARQNFPEYEFLEVGDLAEMPFPDERFELVLSVMALQRSPESVRCPLVSEMWRALRRGGWLVFVEEVVQGTAEEAATSSPLRAEELETLVVEGSGGGAMLEHFEAIRYPHDDVHRAGLMVCSKVSGLEDPVRLHGLTSRSKVPQLDR